MWTPKWIPRDPAKVVDEIEYYVEHFGARNFPFQDLTAIIRREWIVDFCNRLLDRGLQITWQMPTGTRSEAIDAEVASLLRRTGMISMAYAPESGSEETRRLIKKKMKTDRLFQSMRAALAEGLNVMVFLVIGFPHDTEDHLRENFAFLDAMADIGITDVAVGFYMALPGTQMFDSLYDNGKIVINRRYFRHILAATSLWSTSTYNEHLSNVELTVWKFRLFRHFYRRRRTGRESRSLASSAWRSVFRLRRKGGDESKFETAFRNGVVSGIETAKCKLHRGWMSRADEERFFEGWDDIFREIREKNTRDGIHMPRTRRHSSTPRDQRDPATESRARRPPPHPGQGGELTLRVPETRKRPQTPVMSGPDPTRSSAQPTIGLIAIGSYDYELLSKSLSEVPAVLRTQIRGLLIPVVDGPAPVRRLDGYARTIDMPDLQCLAEQFDLPVTIALLDPEDVMYGVIQKVAFGWAIDEQFDIAAVVHASGHFPMSSLDRMIEPIAAGEAGAVFARRVNKNGAWFPRGISWWKVLGNRYLCPVLNRIVGHTAHDWLCPFRAYSTSVLRSMPIRNNSDESVFDLEMLLGCVELREQLAEFEVPVEPDTCLQPLRLRSPGEGLR